MASQLCPPFHMTGPCKHHVGAVPSGQDTLSCVAHPTLPSASAHPGYDRSRSLPWHMKTGTRRIQISDLRSPCQILVARSSRFPNCLPGQSTRRFCLRAASRPSTRAGCHVPRRSACGKLPMASIAKRDLSGKLTKVIRAPTSQLRHSLMARTCFGITLFHLVKRCGSMRHVA